MSTSSAPRPPDDSRLVSSGRLPDSGTVQALLDDCHARIRDVQQGAVSTVYPALSQVDPALFGLTIVGVDGQAYSSGDSDVEFTLMSCAEPFVFALACQIYGVDEVCARVGVNATGLPFNSIAAIERESSGRTNPMVNSGALATTGLLAGSDVDSDWAPAFGRAIGLRWSSAQR